MLGEWDKVLWKDCPAVAKGPCKFGSIAGLMREAGFNKKLKLLFIEDAIDDGGDIGGPRASLLGVPGCVGP